MQISQTNRSSKLLPACTSCRIRKTKCDKQKPCENCIRHSFECSYHTESLGGRAVSRKHSTASREQRIAPVTAIASSESSTSALNEHFSEQGKTTEPSDQHFTSAVTDFKDDFDVLTTGREFHGPSGILSFLTHLRDKSYEDGSGRNATTDTNHMGKPASPSLVKFILDEPERSSEVSVSHMYSASDVLLEQELVRLFFSNLHLIHPVIDRERFLKRCNAWIWTPEATSKVLHETGFRLFLSIYNAVLALGAVVSSDDEQSVLHLQGLANVSESNSEVLRTARTPFQLAGVYFHRAKHYLGDVFTARSPASTVSLLLLAIYCQNALRPAEQYLYSGMAVRTALASGIAYSASSTDTSLSRIWWILYSHELEMCTSAGRPSALDDTASYSIPLPASVGASDPVRLVHYMVPFASLLKQVLQQVYSENHQPIEGRQERSRRSFQIDQQLREWKAWVDSEMTSGNRFISELVWKQKVTVDLRFENARILLHRPFLPTSSLSYPRDVHHENADYDHLSTCLMASRNTIRILDEAYTSRPYFRTWYYNTTYLMYAIMNILYVLAAGDFADSCLSADVETSLAILNSMRGNAVAIRCARIVEDVYDALKKRARTSSTTAQPSGSVMNGSNSQWSDGHWDWTSLDDILLSELTETNFMDTFLDFDMVF